MIPFPLDLVKFIFDFTMISPGKKKSHNMNCNSLIYCVVLPGLEPGLF